MKTFRLAGERGHADHGWLDSWHTFSFADYNDPRHMGFRSLRVINEDRVAAGGGFPPHGHRDMEILSYVLEGQLAHKDSMGTGSIIKPGELQRMSAGSGVTHSEMNASKTEGVHFLQIWIVPAQRGLPPGYEQKTFGGDLRLVASPDGADGSVTLRQDVRLFAGKVAGTITHKLATGRHAWVHVARGRVSVGGRELAAGDAVSFSEEPSVEIAGIADGEVLLFDLA